MWGTEERSLASETAAEKAIESWHLRLLARHLTENWKTGRRACFDKRLGRSV
jgi:hypothetical protein